MADEKQVNIRLDPLTHRRLKGKVAAQETTIQQVGKELLGRWVYSGTKLDKTNNALLDACKQALVFLNALKADPDINVYLAYIHLYKEVLCKLEQAIDQAEQGEGDG